AVPAERAGQGRLERVGELAQVEVDQAAREVARQVGGEGLDDVERVEKSGGKEVERNYPLLGVGAGKSAAVEEGLRVALAESAHEDEPVVPHGYPGGAADDRCDVGAGRLLHGLGADLLAHRGRRLALEDLRLLA